MPRRARRRGKSRRELVRPDLFGVTTSHPCLLAQVAREEEWKKLKGRHQRKVALAAYVSAGGDPSDLSKSVSDDHVTRLLPPLDADATITARRSLPSLESKDYSKKTEMSAWLPKLRIGTMEVSSSCPVLRTTTTLEPQANNAERSDDCGLLSKDAFVAGGASPGGGGLRVSRSSINNRIHLTASRRRLGRAKPPSPSIRTRARAIVTEALPPVLAISSSMRPVMPTRSPIGETYNLVWADCFDYHGIPSPARWEYQLDANDWIHDARHCEAQWYTDKIENARVADGRLRIVARAEQCEGYAYTSARLRTKYNGDWTYGRIEVRARLPPSRRGLWPAIWMLPTDEVYGSWPHSELWPCSRCRVTCLAGGEIDIMEHVGWQDDGLIHSAAHSTKYNPLVEEQRSTSLLVPDAHASFHTYCLDWDEQRLLILVDNELCLTVENDANGGIGGVCFFFSLAVSCNGSCGGAAAGWPYDQRFHLLLNLAIGGWGGQYGIDDEALPACMEVDSVRVFKKRRGPRPI